MNDFGYGLVFTRDSDPLTHDFCTDFAWDDEKQRFERRFLPFIGFKDLQQVNEYLVALDNQYDKWCEQQIDAGLTPAILLESGQFQGQLHRILPIIDALTEGNGMGYLPKVEIQSVALADASNNLRYGLPAVLFFQGWDRPLHIVGSRFVINAVVDLGEMAGPIFRGSTDMTPMRRSYTLRLWLGDDGLAGLGIACQLINDNATAKYSSKEPTGPDGAFFPLFDPSQYRFDQLIETDVLSDAIYETLGPVPESISEFADVKPNPQLKTVDLILMMKFPHSLVDHAKLARFVRAVVDLDDWIIPLRSS